MPGRAEMTLQVDADDRIPLGLVHREDHPVAQDAGVVDQHVETSEGVDGASDELAGLGEVGDVGTVGDRLTAHGLDFCNDLLGGTGVGAVPVGTTAQVVDHNLGPFTGEHQGVLTADASASPRDDGHPSLTYSTHAILQSI